jgi:hypothetical protein
MLDSMGSFLDWQLYGQTIKDAFYKDDMFPSLLRFPNIL